MKRTTSLRLAALAGLAGLAVTCLGATPASAAAQPAPPLLKVMPLGDSITAGAGSSTGAGYRLPLSNLISAQSRYNVDLVGSGSFGALQDPDNEGHGGFMINDIQSGIDGWMSAANPDVVLLHLGINDLDRGTDKAHAADRLSALTDRILADKPGVTVIVQGLIPTTGDLQDLAQNFNAGIKSAVTAKQAAGKKVRYVEPPALSSNEMADRLHPNDRGYAKLSQAFYGGLDKAFSDGLAVAPKISRAGSESGGAGRVRWADFDGDGKADYVIVNDNGSVQVFLNKGGDGRGGWQDLGQVATGITNDKSRIRFADFDGDGKADYITLDAGGAVNVYLNKGGDNGGGWQNLGKVATGLTANPDQVRFADFDGDGKSDYVTFNTNGAVNVFLNRGGDTGGGWKDLGQVATGITNDTTRVRFADFDGDGRADYTVLNTDGAVTSFLNRGGDNHGGWYNPGLLASGVTTDQNLVSFADINGDGHADYLLTNGPTSAFVYNGGDGHGGWTDYGRIASGV